MGIQLFCYPKDHYQIHKQNQVPVNLKFNPHNCILFLKTQFKLCMNSSNTWLQTFRPVGHCYVMPLMTNITYCSKYQMSPTKVSELWLLFYGPVGPWMAKMLEYSTTTWHRNPKDNKHLRSSSVYKPYSLQKRGYGLVAIISDIFRMLLLNWGMQWHSRLRHCATSQEVMGLIPNTVTGISTG